MVDEITNLAVEESEEDRARIDSAMRRKFNRQTTKSGLLLGIFIGGFAGLLFSSWLMFFGFGIAVAVAHGEWMYHGIRKLVKWDGRPIAESWELCQAIARVIDYALWGFCVILFVLFMFHYSRAPKPCNPNCRWCRQAVEDFYDQEPPDRRP